MTNDCIENTQMWVFSEILPLQLGIELRCAVITFLFILILWAIVAYY